MTLLTAYSRDAWLINLDKQLHNLHNLHILMVKKKMYFSLVKFVLSFALFFFLAFFLFIYLSIFLALSRSLLTKVCRSNKSRHSFCNSLTSCSDLHAKHFVFPDP